MGFIIEGFLGLALLLAAIWIALFLRAKRADDAQRAEEAREARVQALLQTPGERLYCVACQKLFDGPLSEDGCPTCGCASFVVPERLRGGGPAVANTPADTVVTAPAASTTATPDEAEEPKTDVLRASRGGGSGAV
jgi:hypothetical protein